MSPGRKGTKHLVARYGAQLVCVRYRYDAERQVRQTTVELVVSERPWRPLVSRCAPDEIVGIAIGDDEPDLLARMCRMGAWFNPGTGQWRLRLDRALALGLASRVRHLRKPTD